MPEGPEIHRAADKVRKALHGKEIEDIEVNEWPKVLRHAALRFWLSRLHDKFFPTDGEITHQLNPDEFKSILLDRINSTYILKI